MSTYTPKVGDRVRAVSGESVVVGSVVGAYAHAGVLVDVDSRGLFHLRAGKWEFTQVVEPTVLKPLGAVQVAPGVVVRVAEGNWQQFGKQGVRLSDEGVDW